MSTSGAFLLPVFFLFHLSQTPSSLWALVFLLSQSSQNFTNAQMAKTTPLCKPHKIFISYGQTKAVPHPTLGIKAKTYLYNVTEFLKTPKFPFHPLVLTFFVPSLLWCSLSFGDRVGWWWAEPSRICSLATVEDSTHLWHKYMLRQIVI